MSPQFRTRDILLGTLGAGLAVAAVVALAHELPGLLLLGSFGASALLIFALPETPYAQPRSVVSGHLLASGIAWLCLHICGPGVLAAAAATGLGVGAMMLTRTVHPPAASNGIIVCLAKPTLAGLLLSTIGGAAVLVLIGTLYHKTLRHRDYPRYWWRPQ